MENTISVSSHSPPRTHFTRDGIAIIIASVNAATLILTVKNEAEALPRLFDSVLGQTRAPFQVVVTDGGSTDRTKEVLKEYARRLDLIVIDCPGANISQGRNAAIARAAGDIIASTDAGVRLDPHWLEEIAKPFDDGADVVSGFFVPDTGGIFGTALAATTLPTLEDIRPEKFLPSSRSVAFRKSAWQAAGGYPAWLDYCEDLVFDLALRSAGCRFTFAPRARVFFRPRASLRQFARQYFLYARGDGKANLWPKRHLLRYSTYLIGLPLSIAIFPRLPGFSLGLWILGFLVMFLTPYRRLFGLWGGLNTVQKAAAMAWVPPIRVTGDVAKMVGYPVGVWWRIRNRG
jgi:glycosyltransferase involved in cell wall biosynthesis